MDSYPLPYKDLTIEKVGMKQFYDEGELVQGCKKDIPKYQQALYQQYYRTMFGICLRYATHTSDAEDMLQEGFIKVYKYIHTFREEGSLEGWIKRIVIRTCIHHYRKAIRFPTIDLKAEYGQEIGPEALSTLGCQELLKLISTLPKGYRTIFNLYAVEGYSHQEISELLNIKVGTSKSQLSRARILLQKRLKASQEIKKKKEHERAESISSLSGRKVQPI